MKFLLVNHEYPPVGAGAATATHALGRHLSALGHAVAVLTSGYDNLPRLTTEENVIVYRIRCIRKRIDRSSIMEMLSFLVAALCSLPRILREERPNALIIFFSLPSGPIGLAGRIFAGLPYVVSLRGGDVPGLVPELKSIHRILIPIRRFVLKRASAIVANSKGLQKLAEAADPFPVRVIPNGVDTDFFRPAIKGELPQRLRILFVGRFQNQKNLSFLLQETARLAKNTVELHLAGDGPEREQLERLAAKLRIADAITWHGWLSHSNLLRVYQSADCLVNPSLYEGMPNVVLEAMACGLPAIASNVPGNNELILNGETGFLFDLHNDYVGFTTLLNRLRDVDLRRGMGESARARAVELFSWRTVATRYVDLFSAKHADAT